jgi:hypothetical protein
MDPDPVPDPARDPDPTPNPTSLFIDFKNAKQKKFHIFFSQLAHRYIIFSQNNFYFFLKLCVTMFFCRYYFSPLNTFMRKGKDPDPEPDPDL